MLQVFNRNTKYLQKERAAADVETSRKVDYLRDEVAVRLCERLLVSCFRGVSPTTRSQLPILILTIIGHYSSFPFYP